MSGISTVSVANAPSVTLVFDSTLSSGDSAATAPSLAPTKPITITTTQSSDPGPTADSHLSNSSSTASAEPIPIATVIGVCIAALVGTALVILLGWWFYKRSTRSYKHGPKRRSRAPLTDKRNARGEQDRSKSRAENWVNLEEADSRWEGEYQTKELGPFGRMEKLNMFEKASTLGSVGKSSMYTDDRPLVFENHPYSAYYPNLAEEHATAQTPQFLDRVDAGPPISWGDNITATSDPLLVIKSSLLTPNDVSPTRHFAIPTPQAVAIEPHRWESAQVMDYDEEMASRGLRSGGPDKPSRSKGKDRVHNPFADQFAVTKPSLHVATSSSSSTESRERALQSLIAALETTPEQVQERLRVASMQTTIISPADSYVDEEDVTAKFPLPPS